MHYDIFVYMDDIPAPGAPQFIPDGQYTLDAIWSGHKVCTIPTWLHWAAPAIGEFLWWVYATKEGMK